MPNIQDPISKEQKIFGPKFFAQFNKPMKQT